MHPSYINNSNNNNNNNNNTSFCYYNQEELVLKSSNSPVVLETKCTLTGIGRSSKKDRHSKINTARGPRDRRMRLSIDVAKRFFNLQDMLGFDKASNTIEWLLMKSKTAIRDLHRQQYLSLMGLSNSASSASECEVMSGSIDDQSTEKNEEDNKVIIKEKKKVERVVKKSVYIDHCLAKESREKARARARKRTNEKRNIKIFGCYDGAANCHQFSTLRPNSDQVIDQNTNRLGSWIPFGENQVPLTDQSEYASSHFQFKEGIGGDGSSMMSTNWSPSFLFNYQHTNPVISHEPQFSDLQFFGKPWEGINN